MKKIKSLRGKKIKSLRGRIFVDIMIVAMFPILIFAIISQGSLRAWQKNDLQERMQANIENADRCLDIQLDKYNAILFDLCTDDVVVEAVENINNNNDAMEVNTSKLRHELSHVCNRNQGIEGITIFLANGEVIFYDKQNSSSISSDWAGKVHCPEVKKEQVYQGQMQPIVVNDKHTYLLQIARNLIDYRDIHEKLGTVVFSIAEQLISDTLQVGANANTYLLERNYVISAPSVAKIGRTLDSVKNTKKNLYISKVNQMSQFTICIERDISTYRKTMNEQVGLLLGVAFIAFLVMIFLSYIFTRPYIYVMQSVGQGFHEVETGNFETRLEFWKRAPEEIKDIEFGFNEMVENLDNLINQVKQAVLEQKNAELSALEAQIDPHFLYNTLDSINWKAIENEQYDISSMLVALANILRYTVDNAGGTSTLAQELGWLKQYMVLQGTRMGKIPVIETDIPEELFGFQIHKLLLQPFVENSVKYGFYGKEEECVLKISARQMEYQIHIQIEDNGNGITQDMLAKINDEQSDMKGHLGITNVRKRLKLYYGEEAMVYFESEEHLYTRVHLFIPMTDEHQEVQ